VAPNLEAIRNRVGDAHGQGRSGWQGAEESKQRPRWLSSFGEPSRLLLVTQQGGVAPPPVLVSVGAAWAGEAAWPQAASRGGRHSSIALVRQVRTSVAALIWNSRWRRVCVVSCAPGCTELTVDGGPRVRIQFPPAASHTKPIIPTDFDGFACWCMLRPARPADANGAALTFR